MLAIAGLVSTSSAQASRPGHDLASLVRNADFVVFGTVDKVSKSPIAESQNEKIYSSAVAIETCFKRTIGPFPQIGPKLKYMFLTGGPEDPSIRLGRKYILFLKDSDIGPYPLDGAVGVVPVENGKANTAIVQGEPPEQQLDSLRKRIQAYAQGFGCE